ncbi:ATP-binding protein [Spirosoma sp. KNUC1025]|uniref:ATP-binding protein n=1 Tax=Spirosoma sp. KNUC1025 TaxID=2894082 RepID=UPI003870AF38|nr:AAA family ATPase [Spirosoma sp. KNUC1025]
MPIQRALYRILQTQLSSGKVLLVVGARGSGKTALINQLANTYSGPKLILSGEENASTELLSNRTIAHYTHWLNDTQLLILDEVKAIPDYEKSLKFLVESFSHLTVVATSSSSFDTAIPDNKLALDRQVTYTIYPLSQLELGATETYLQTREYLEERLIFGSYPDIVQAATSSERIDLLTNTTLPHLLEDVLLFDQVRNSEKMVQLLRLIAYQIGQEISYDELSYQLQIDRNTVVRYLELFAKVFILFRVGGFGQNHPKEVTKSSKWYFFDNGVRNALINNFSLLSQRYDAKALWENYLVAERIKRNTYLHNSAKPYFWRTYDQQQLDWLEENNGQLKGYVFSWQMKKKRLPKGFSKAYPTASLSIINPENYLDFITHNYFDV